MTLLLQKNKEVKLKGKTELEMEKEIVISQELLFKNEKVVQMRLQFALRRNAGQQPNSANGKNVSLDFIQTVKPQKDLLLKKGLDADQFRCRPV